MRVRLVTTILSASLLIVGCVNEYVIPEPLEKQVDRTVTFTDLKRDPEAHKGKILALGGVVLGAKHLKGGTEIEILQLPLDRSDRPDYPLEASQGRFLILDPDHHDPAVLKDRRITLVGEVIGKKIETIDEYEYSFPYLSARLIYVWPERRAYGYYPPYYYPYPYYYPFPYYSDPYWYPPYWYNRPPVFVPPASPPPQRRFETPSGKEPSPPPQAPDDHSKRRFEN